MGDGFGSSYGFSDGADAGSLRTERGYSRHLCAEGAVVGR
jgi:hypothetical protein